MASAVRFPCSTGVGAHRPRQLLHGQHSSAAASDRGFSFCGRAIETFLLHTLAFELCGSIRCPSCLLLGFMLLRSVFFHSISLHVSCIEAFLMNTLSCQLCESTNFPSCFPFGFGLRRLHTSRFSQGCFLESLSWQGLGAVAVHLLTVGH